MLFLIITYLTDLKQYYMYLKSLFSTPKKLLRNSFYNVWLALIVFSQIYPFILPFILFFLSLLYDMFTVLNFNYHMENECCGSLTECCRNILCCCPKHQTDELSDYINPQLHTPLIINHGSPNPSLSHVSPVIVLAEVQPEINSPLSNGSRVIAPQPSSNSGSIVADYIGGDIVYKEDKYHIDTTTYDKTNPTKPASPKDMLVETPLSNTNRTDPPKPTNPKFIQTSSIDSNSSPTKQLCNIHINSDHTMSQETYNDAPQDPGNVQYQRSTYRIDISTHNNSNPVKPTPPRDMLSEIPLSNANRTGPPKPTNINLDYHLSQQTSNDAPQDRVINLGVPSTLNSTEHTKMPPYSDRIISEDPSSKGYVGDTDI